MSFALSEVLPPSSPNAIAFVPNFDMNGNVLAVGRGNKLYIYQIESGFIGNFTVLDFYGEIAHIVPLTHGISSNIFVILRNLNACILKYNMDDDTIVTDFTGNLNTAYSTMNSYKDIKIRVIPSALVMQISSTCLMVYPITTNSDLAAPFPLIVAGKTGCKRILDFVFLGPISKVTRLAVLTEEISGSPKLRMIEIDITENKYIEDQVQTVELQEDTYLIIPLIPETSATIVAFSGKRATLIQFTSGIAPKITTKTINTPEKIKWYAEMDESNYVLIDERGKMKIADLAENLPVSIVDVHDVPLPIDVARIDKNIVFVASSEGISTFYQLNYDHPPSASILFQLPDTGCVRDIVKEDDTIVAVCSKAIVFNRPSIKLRKLCIFELPGSCGIWMNHGEEADRLVLSQPSTSFALTGADGVYEPLEIDDFINDQTTIHAAFYGDGHIQVTPTLIRFGNGTKLEGDFSCADSSESYLAVTTATGCALYSSTNGSLVKEIEGEYTACAISDTHCAFATPNDVQIYTLGMNLVDTVRIPYPAVGLSIIDGEIVVAHPSDYISILAQGNKKARTLHARGYHSTVRTIDNKAVVFGEFPVIVENAKCVRLGKETAIDGVGFEGQLYMLVENGMLIASLEDQQIQHECIQSERSLDTIREVPGGYVFTADDALYCLPDFRTGGTAAHAFKEERVRGLEIIDRLAVVATSKRLCAFGLDRTPELTSMKTRDHPTPALSIGIFQDLLYVVGNRTVQLLAVERANAEEVSFTLVSQLTVVEDIRCACGGTELFAVATKKKTIFVYKKVANDRLNLLAKTVLMDTPKMMALVNNTLVVCTNEATVAILTLAEESSSLYSIKAETQFSIGSSATSIKPSAKSVLIGTESGSVIELSEINPPRRFSDLYHALETQMTSAGAFRKDLQRAVQKGAYVMNFLGVIDRGLLEDFLALGEDAQAKVLEHAQMTPAEAKHLISIL